MILPKREILGILALGVSAGIILALIILLGGIGETSANETEVPGKVLQSICQTPGDCEGLPHILCIGAWACEAGKCVWGCEIKQDIQPAEGEPEGVLFIEQHKNIDGTVIAGGTEYTFLGEPDYVFDRELRTLNGTADFNVEDLKAIYGSINSLSGETGSGSSSRLYPVEALPADVGNDRVVQIYNNGTVVVEHANHTITLVPGESWSETTIEDSTGRFGLGIARLTSTDSVMNHGYIPEGNIMLSTGG